MCVPTVHVDFKQQKTYTDFLTHFKLDLLTRSKLKIQLKVKRDFISGWFLWIDEPNSLFVEKQSSPKVRTSNHGRDEDDKQLIVNWLERRYS